MELMLLDKNLDRIDVIDNYESLIWTERYYECGDFEIYALATTDLINKLIIGRYLCSPSSEHVMIIENISLTTGSEDGAHLIVSGKSLESILNRRIIWSQILLQGYLEDQLEKLFNVSVLQPKDNRRKIDNLIFKWNTDPWLRNLRIDAQYTGNNLYDTVSDICKEKNIGFKITLNSKKQFVFTLYFGADRSFAQTKNPYVIFSPKYENLVNTKFIESDENYRNVALVAGEGEGLQRRTFTAGDLTVSGLDRRELYVDARDISSTDENGNIMADSAYNEQLQQRGNEKLSGYKKVTIFDGQAEITQMFRYGEHFFMGDICQIENEFGIAARVQVLEHIYSNDVNGTQDYTTFEVVEETA